MNANDLSLRLGRLADSEPIAAMSRDLVETGLGWSWTPARVAKSIRCRDTVTLIGNHQKKIVAFAIMYFGQDQAHLNLLAVRPDYQRVGIGRLMVDWLEKSARVAGIQSVTLEVRANNHSARRFYRKLGFWEQTYLPGYYQGSESAIRMIHELCNFISPSTRDGDAPRS